MEDHVRIVLKAIAGKSVPWGDEKKAGIRMSDSEGIRQATEFEAVVVEHAVYLLERDRLVESWGGDGVNPFSFAGVALTPKGRSVVANSLGPAKTLVKVGYL